MSQKKVRNATEVPIFKMYVLITLLTMYDADNTSIPSYEMWQMQAVSKVFSLDRDAFPSLSGLPGETLHSVCTETWLLNSKLCSIQMFLWCITLLPLTSLNLQYIADNNLENNPWHGVDEWLLKVRWVLEWSLVHVLCEPMIVGGDWVPTNYCLGQYI